MIEYLEAGQFDRASRLVKMGATLDSSLLHFSSTWQFNVVEWLINNGADMSGMSNGQTALHFLYNSRKWDLISLCLAKGADVFTILLFDLYFILFFF